MPDDSELEGSEAYNGFRVVGAEIRRRLRKPARHVTFVLFGAVGIAGFGCMAIWLEWHRWYVSAAPGNFESIKLALATTAPAIATPSSMEMVFNKEESNVLKSLGVFLFMMCVLPSLYLIEGSPADSTALILGHLACALAIMTWWLSAADNENILDRPKPDAAAGGSPKRKLATRTTTVRT